MHSASGGGGLDFYHHTATDVNSVEEDKKPKLFSVAWFKNLGSALRFDKYSARDWAIWNLSSWATYAVVFGFTKLLVPLLNYVVSMLPSGLVTAAKAVFTKVAVFFAALVHIFSS